MVALVDEATGYQKDRARTTSFNASLRLTCFLN